VLPPLEGSHTASDAAGALSNVPGVVDSLSGGQLSDRVAVVTGASSGLGRATAARLATDGAAVALLARSAEDLAITQAGITESGRHRAGGADRLG
jgi:short chain dehydrogenase